MKKLTAILLAVIMALSVLPVRAFSDYDDDNEYYDEEDDDDDGDIPDEPIVDVYDKTETLEIFETDNCRFIVITNNCCITVDDDDPFEYSYSILVEKGSRLVINSRDMKGFRASIICEGELEIAEGASLSLDRWSSLVVLEKGRLTVNGSLDVSENSSIYCFGRCTGDDGIQKAEIAGAMVFRRSYNMVEVYYPSVEGDRDWFWQITDRSHKYYGSLDAKKMLPKRISALREQNYTDDNMEFIFLSSGEDEWHAVFLLTDGRTLEMAVKGYKGKTVSMCGIRFDMKTAPLVLG